MSFDVLITVLFIVAIIYFALPKSSRIANTKRTETKEPELQSSATQRFNDALSQNNLPYRAKPYLQSKAELNFLHALQACLPNSIMINSKVRLADILDIPTGLSASDRFRYFSKISQKHVDFILTQKSDSAILCCIELDDSSHNNNTSMLRDQFVNSAFQSAHLPIMRHPVKYQYDINQLKTLLSKHGITTI